MRIFFLGDYRIQGGPSQVNRQLIKYLPADTMILKAQNKIAQLFECCLKTITADTIIYSSPMRADIPSLYLTKFLKKSSIYIMHGNIKYESKENNEPNPIGEKIENMLLRQANIVLCVSVPFCKWAQSEYPEYAYKMKVLSNGIEWNEMPQSNISTNRDEKLVIAMGGGRVTKKNLQIAKAIEYLNENEGADLRLEIYGRKKQNDDTEALINIPCCNFVGLLPREKLFARLRESSLYIQNSIFEPFGLAVIEALVCGNNLIVSKYIGANDIIPGLENQDIIEDPDDINEIALHIQKAITNPNCDRLLDSIDRQATSSKMAATNLMRYCLSLEKDNEIIN